jgi:hypothetical protein
MLKKIIFVAIIIGIGIYFFNHSKNPNVKVLGVSTERINTVAQNPITKNVENIAGSVASNTAQIVSNIAFSVALNPIVDHINSLPIAKQQEIKEALCK